MNDNSIDKRLRKCEAMCGSRDAVDAERWRVQFAFNEKCEDRMKSMEKCMGKFSTAIAVSNAKIIMVFVVIQLAIAGLLVAVMKELVLRQIQ